MVEIICTVIGAVIGTIGGALIGFAASWLTLKYNYHKLFAETVSKNRMEWINVWRENISQFLSAAKILRDMKNNNIYPTQRPNSNNNDLCYNALDKYHQSHSMITTRLNLSEPLHEDMLYIINNFKYDTSISDNNFKKQCEEIEDIARQILKPEWERVKREARGKEK